MRLRFFIDVSLGSPRMSFRRSTKELCGMMQHGGGVPLAAEE